MHSLAALPLRKSNHQALCYTPVLVRFCPDSIACICELLQAVQNMVTLPTWKSPQQTKFSLILTGKSLSIQTCIPTTTMHTLSQPYMVCVYTTYVVWHAVNCSDPHKTRNDKDSKSPWYHNRCSELSPHPPPHTHTHTVYHIWCTCSMLFMWLVKYFRNLGKGRGGACQPLMCPDERSEITPVG